MSKALKITGIVLALMFVMGGLMYFGATYRLAEVRSTEIHPVDISAVPDGEYTGSFCAGRWCYNLSVAVAEGRITAIRLLDDKMASYGDANQKLIDSVIAKQDISLPIDAYTAASVHGKAFLKAVERALNGNGKGNGKDGCDNGGAR